MSIIETARKTLTELPISDVLRERLFLALDESAALERKIAEMQAQIGELRAELKIAQSNEQQSQAEIDKFHKKHEEYIVIFHTVEFRRGLRTNGKWMPFCPKCHLPLKISRKGGDPVLCSDHNCGWVFNGISQELWNFENNLPS